MPSSPKIPKEKILETALFLLIRDGYDKINIKTLAKELGCSTQPISWHFGNMEGLRKELAEYALAYMDKKIQTHAENAFEAFSKIGDVYVNLAYDEPNLFKFLFMDGSSGYCIGSMEMICGLTENNELVESISSLFDITANDAAEYVGNCSIYSHGLLSLIVSGVLKDDKSKILQMINNAGYAFFLKVGGDIDFAMKLNEKTKNGQLK